MSKGGGSTRRSTPTGTKTAGEYGMKVLGKRYSEKTISGISTGFSYKPNQEKLREHATEYLNTGKFNAYGSKAAPMLVDKIARDLRVRGAHVYADGKYLATYDGYKVLLSKKKDGSWQAKTSSSSENSNKNGSMREALWNTRNKI